MYATAWVLGGPSSSEDRWNGGGRESLSPRASWDRTLDGLLGTEHSKRVLLGTEFDALFQAGKRVLEHYLLVFLSSNYLCS